MSENLNAGERLEELSKPGNEAELEKVLSQEFNQATNAVEVKTTEDDKKSEKNDDNSDENNQKESEDDKKSSDDNSGDHSNDGDNKAGDRDNKTSRIQDLLSDRNNAKKEAAEAQTENAMLSKRVEDLTKLVEKLTSGKTGEGELSDDDNSTDEKPLTKAQAKAYVDELISEKENESKKLEVAEKSISDDIQNLVSKPNEFPNAGDFKKEISDVMKQFPTMKAKAAYALLKGDGIIPSEVNNSNANKTTTGQRSKSNLTKTQNSEGMTQAEREEYLFKEQASGNLRI